MKVFGIDNITEDTTSSLKQGDSVVLLGELGCGSSTILRQVLRRLCEESFEEVVFLTSVRNEKPLLQEICFQLKCEEEKKIFSSGNRSLTTSALAGMVRSKIKSVGSQVICIVDFEGSLPGSGNALRALCELHSLGVTFLVCAHSLNKNNSFIERLGRPMEIAGLDEKDSGAYIEYLVEGWVIEDLGYVKRELFIKTKGYPGLIEKALERYQKSRHLTNEIIDSVEKLHTAKVRYMYLWVCIPMLFVLIFNRYLSRLVEGEHDRVSIVLGCLGMILGIFLGKFVLPFLKNKGKK